MKPDRFRQLGEWLIRRRGVVLAAWCILLGAGFYFSCQVDNILQGSTQIPGYPSQRVAQLLNQKFANRFGHEVVLIFYSPTHRASEAGFQQAVERVQAGLRDSALVANLISYYDTESTELVSKDRRTVLGLVALNVADSFGAQKATAVLREKIRRAGAPDWLWVYLTGQGATYYDIIHASQEDALWAEAQSFPLVAVILIFTFGALVAAGIPVILGLVAVSVALGLIYLAGMSYPMFILAKNAVTMIGLGVGIDYSQFMVSRFREELRSSGTAEAIARMMATAGRTVIFSGITVMIGLASVFIPNLPFLNSMAIAAIAVVLVAMAAALTLLPVLFSWIGERINWPIRLAKLIGTKDGRIWQKISWGVMRHPLWFFGLTLLLMLVVAYPLRYLKTNTLTVVGLPRGAESRMGFERLQTDFVAGMIAPIEIVIRAPEGRSIWNRDAIARIYRLSRLLAARNQVDKVEGIVDIDPQLNLVDYQKLYTTAGGISASDSIFGQMVNCYVDNSGRGEMTLMRVTAVGEPGSVSSRELVGAIRSQYVPEAFAGSPYQVLVGGSSALQVDLDRLLMGKLPLVIGIVCLATLLVLTVLFRSILIPLKSIFMNILSVLASFGFLVFVFQNVSLCRFLGFQSPEGISSIILILLFAVLFGLSMDYEIFLTLRIKEEHDQGYSNEESVARGLAKTGGLVTSAALIMVAVFGAFAFTSMIMTQEFGLGLAAAVFLDASVIRILLMPATMRLMGEYNWWFPSFLKKHLPHIGRFD